MQCKFDFLTRMKFGEIIHKMSCKLRQVIRCNLHCDASQCFLKSTPDLIWESTTLL